ncbi:MAG TPA: argininosuccinate synthase [Hyphomicrobiaceae bacterium]|nr:argininosuccinate synthase [Hyphomicrobiaceae bacterium]
MPAKDTKSKVNKVVLAYSGGLDTSIILKWLQETYQAEVVTFTADLGQGEELEPARRKAEMLGVKNDNIFIEDLREEFIRDYVFPMFRANALYEGVYLLGTSIARPLIGKTQIDIARKTGADAVCHGATGKGNDQVRFELTYYALEPSIRIIAPWREWSFKSREELVAFAQEHQIPVAKDKRGEAPFSVDANMLHSSSEGKVLEDPALEAPAYVYQRTVSPMEAPDKVTELAIGFAKGDAVSLDGKTMSAAALFARLNELGRDNGIGRIDLVENRFVGMKSRGIYETPGGTILLAAHRAIESITLDRGAAHLKDELMPRYAELIYNGFWFAPERLMLQALIDKSQEHVEGLVRLKLYKGNVIVTGRESEKSLYSSNLVTFEDDKGAYDQKDAAGFIRLSALRLRTLGQRNRRGDMP